MLRQPDGSGQAYGKVVIDLRNGKIWGFPTGTLDTYPSNPLDSKPVTSTPWRSADTPSKKRTSSVGLSLHLQARHLRVWIDVSS